MITLQKLLTELKPQSLSEVIASGSGCGKSNKVKSNKTKKVKSSKTKKSKSSKCRCKCSSCPF